MQRAFDLLHAGDAGEAARRLSLELQGTPDNPDVCADLALAFAHLGEDEAALQLLERAHYLRPSDARLLFLYGLGLEKAGQINPARLRYEGVLRLDPDHRGARARLTEIPDPLTQALQRLTLAPPPSLTPARVPGTQGEATPSSPATSVSPVAPSPPAEPPLQTAVAAVPAPVSPTPANSERALAVQERRPVAVPRREPLPPAAAEAAPLWTPPPPGFWALARATLLLWAQNPLLWVALFIVPNLAAGFLPANADFRIFAVMAWIASFGVGAAAVLLVMSEQWVRGGTRHLLRRWPVDRFLKGLLLVVPYALVALGPWCATGALRTPLPMGALILGTLLFTTPFHSLLAPSLMLAVTEKRGFRTIPAALRMAGRRTWYHLGVFVLLGVGAGGVLFAYAWGFAVTLHWDGELVNRLMQIAGVSAGESLWAAAVTVCGLDAVVSEERPAAD